jgi:hypothetical protein
MADRNYNLSGAVCNQCVVPADQDVVGIVYVNLRIVERVLDGDFGKVKFKEYNHFPIRLRRRIDGRVNLTIMRKNNYIFLSG